jgi:hypothetical protein
MVIARWLWVDRLIRQRGYFSVSYTIAKPQWRKLVGVVTWWVLESRWSGVSPILFSA